MQINLTYSLEEVNSILSMLGEVPAKYGVYPLIVSIKEKAEASVKANETKDNPEPV